MLDRICRRGQVPPRICQRPHVGRIRVTLTNTGLQIYSFQTSAVSGSSLSSARASRHEGNCLLRMATKRSLCVGSIR